MAHKSRSKVQAIGTNASRLAHSNVETGRTKQQIISKIKSSIEVKMVINSLILYILMIIIATTWVLGAYNIGSQWTFSPLQMHFISTDIFNLINPLLLIILSGTVRKMFIKFFKCQKYSL